MILGTTYAPNRSYPDMWAYDRENRYYIYLEGLIKVEISLNPNPTDEGYQKLLIEVAKSCCRQEQRIALVELLGFNKKEEDDE